MKQDFLFVMNYQNFYNVNVIVLVSPRINILFYRKKKENQYLSPQDLLHLMLN